MKQFPIRLDDVVKSVPFAIMEPHQAQAIANHGRTLDQLAERGGLTPEEAVAIIENRPWERMPLGTGRLKLQDYAAGAGPASDIAAVIRMLQDMRDGKLSERRGNFNKAIVTLERVKGLL